MIPDFEIKDITAVKQPSKTYDMRNGRIKGFIDGTEALKQSVYRILSTQKGGFAIYSPMYGIDLNNYAGKGSENLRRIERDITAALLRDDRIKSVSGFDFEVCGKSVGVKFSVTSNQGESAEVSIDV